MVTDENFACFDNDAFNAFWDEVEENNGFRGWDWGPNLNCVVQCYNQGMSPAETVSAVLEAAAGL